MGANSSCSPPRANYIGETGSLLTRFKNEPRLKIFLLSCDEKKHPVYKQTKSVPETVFIISLNFKG